MGEMSINLKVHRRERGSAVVETALMMPWIFFLFVGVFTFGFFIYAAICTQSAARAAAIQLAASPDVQTQTKACVAVKAEMNMLPNNNSFANGTCSAAPLIVTKRTLCGTTTATAYPAISCDVVGDAATSCSDCTVDTAAAASEVTVTYQSMPMIPIPGRLAGIMNLTRKAEVRIIAP